MCLGRLCNFNPYAALLLKIHQMFSKRSLVSLPYLKAEGRQEDSSVDVYILHLNIMMSYRMLGGYID